MGKIVSRKNYVVSEESTENDTKNTTGSIFLGLFLVVFCIIGAAATMMLTMR